MMRQKQDHIHQNPVRRGYVDRPGGRYPRARNYIDGSGLVDVMAQW
jgi:putative transposase